MRRLLRHLYAWASQDLWPLSPEEAGARYYEPPRRIRLLEFRRRR